MKVIITQEGNRLYPTLELFCEYDAILNKSDEAYVVDKAGTFWYLTSGQFTVAPEKVSAHPVEVDRPISSNDKPLSEVLKGYSKVTLEI